MSDSEKAKVQISNMIKKARQTKIHCDEQYYHYIKSKVLGTIDFCREIGLITGSEAINYQNEIHSI